MKLTNTSMVTLLQSCHWMQMCARNTRSIKKVQDGFSNYAKFKRNKAEICRETSKTLQTSPWALVQAAIRIDNRIRERERERPSVTLPRQSTLGLASGSDASAAPQVSACKPVEPMEIDSALGRRRDPPKRRIVCFRCGQPGHISPNCNSKKGNGQPL